MTKTATNTTTKVKAIPDGYHTATARLVYGNAGKAVEFLKKAFGATVAESISCPDSGKIAHTSLRIGDSRVDLSDEMPGCPSGLKAPAPGVATSSQVNLYLEDVDQAFKQSLAAGAAVKLPPTDMFWGDRLAVVTDPQGQVWGLATHKEDLSPSEILTRQKAFIEQMKSQGCKG